MIVRLLPLLDEEDILERNLRWYAEAGIITVAFDTQSTMPVLDAVGRV